MDSLRQAWSAPRPGRCRTTSIGFRRQAAVVAVGDEVAQRAFRLLALLLELVAAAVALGIDVRTFMKTKFVNARGIRASPSAAHRRRRHRFEPTTNTAVGSLGSSAGGDVDGGILGQQRLVGMAHLPPDASRNGRG